LADGDQRRDFIYVDDVNRGDHVAIGDARCSAGCSTSEPASRAVSRTLMLAAYTRARRQTNIQYIDMPEQIRGSYQYFTQSEVDRLRHAGYNGGFTALEDAVGAYVKGFLDRTDRFR